MTKRSSNNYIDNKKMLAAFITHKAKVDEARKNNLVEPEIPKYIGECFSLLAEKLGSRGNFAGYTYIEEMKADGIESCIIGANNFDPSKTNNPFGYFTKAIWMAFLRRIEKEHKENYIKFKLKQIMMISTDENINVNNGPNDLGIMDNVISNFEEKMKKKKDNAVVENKKNGTRYIKKRKVHIDDPDENFMATKTNTDINLIADYLSKGGKINYVPYGVKATDLLDDEVGEVILPDEVKVLVDIDDEYGEETADD